MGAAFAAGIGSGFWSQDWVLHSDEHTSQGSQDFHPKVPGHPCSSHAEFPEWLPVWVQLAQFSVPCTPMNFCSKAWECSYRWFWYFHVHPCSARSCNAAAVVAYVTAEAAAMLLGHSHALRQCLLHMQADPEEVQKRFRCWQEAVKRSFNLENFELH